MKYPRRNTASRAFTIVETLVAIAILMIAIAGPLVIATRSLTSASVAKNQMVATFLAQESIEVIKNRRDNGTYFGVNGWLMVDNGGSVFDLIQCTEGDPCDAGILNQTAYFNTDCIDMSPLGGTSCRLKYDEQEGYTSGDQSEFVDSPFYRRFYVEEIEYVEYSEKGTHPGEIRVVVIVDWLEGRIPYRTQIVTNLVNVRRL